MAILKVRATVALGAAVVTVSLIATSPGLAHDSSTEHWSEPNSNVKQDRIDSWSIRYPVVGYALPNGYAYKKHASDDFCTEPRTYDNTACISAASGEHAGNDVFAAFGFPSANTGTAAAGGTIEGDDLPVVVAVGGKVVKDECAASAGWYVKIQGEDGRYYLYEHLSDTNGVSEGNLYGPGKRIGLLSDTTSCSGNSGAYHLHFEVHTSTSTGADGGRECCSLDPYLPLRGNFSSPGRDEGVDANGTAKPIQDPDMRAEWQDIISDNGGYEAAIDLVGWPTGWNHYGAPGDANVVTTSDSFSRTGNKQYLGTGSTSFDGRGHRRAGMLHVETGYLPKWVHGLIWKRYSDMSGYDGQDMEDSYLGWAISEEYPDPYTGVTRQDFRGGCIIARGTSIDDNPYVPYPWSHAYC